MLRWKLLFAASICCFLSLNAQGQTRLAVDFVVDGTELKMPLTGGMNAPQLSAVDLNNDGLDDLFVFDRVGNTIQTYINNGNTTDAYDFAPEYIDNFPELRSWVLLRDYNQDGAMDIFAYSDVLGFHGIIAYTGFYNADNEIEFERIIFDDDTNLIRIPLISNPDLETQIYITNIDYPAIDDMDCDGDLDILTFNINGGYVELYENQSVEMGLGLDSLVYRLTEDCWGGFYESGITVELDLASQPGECFENLQDDDQIQFRHAGSTLLTYDNDNDGDKDLVLGDLNFNNLNYLENGGTCEEPWMSEQLSTFPSGNNPVDIPVYPASFYLDINNDGKKDLIGAPNIDRSAEDTDVLWLYENVGTADVPEFSFSQYDFLAGDMVDLGTGADPCFVDYDADGLLDLVVGNNTLYAPFGDKDPRLFLFRNIGTSTEPKFELIDEDYLGLNQFGQTIFDFSPEFGDLDSDGDIDIVIGDNEGRIHYAENIAGPGAPLDFLGWTLLFNNIDVGASSNPEMADLNRDGLMDLVIGEKNGIMNYYRNIGTVGNPDFNPSPTDWPNVEQMGFIDTRVLFSGTGTGESAPVILDFPDGYRLFTGSETGQIEVYESIENSLYDTLEADLVTFANIKEGKNTALDLADINNDGFLDMVVGNWRGGLSFFSTDISLELVAVEEVDNTLPFQVFPNPAKDLLTFEAIQHSDEMKQISLFDAAGRKVLERNWNGDRLAVGVAQLPNGVYYAKVLIDNQFKVEKIIIQ